LLRYLECRPGNIVNDHVFIRSTPHTDPLPPEMGSPPW
jgi:hypothetical protein